MCVDKTLPDISPNTFLGPVSGPGDFRHRQYRRPFSRVEAPQDDKLVILSNPPAIPQPAYSWVRELESPNEVSDFLAAVGGRPSMEFLQLLEKRVERFFR